MKPRSAGARQTLRHAKRVATATGALCLAGTLVGTVFAASSGSAPPTPKPTRQDSSQTCAQANAAVRQVLAVPSKALTTNSPHLLAIAAQLHDLADAAEDDVVQERLDNVADAVRTLSAATQAGDDAAAVGARDVIAGFFVTCPVANTLSGAATTGWVPNARSALAANRAGGPGGTLGSKTATVSATGPGACGIHDASPTVSSTLPGTYRLRVWVRSASGSAPLTVRLSELRGQSLIAQTATSVTAASKWQRVELSVRAKAPRHSALSVDISMSAAKTGACFDVSDVSMTWG
jgi:hypothetical protein